MIKQEQYICKNGVILIHTFSDEGKQIRQIETGEVFDDAYDTQPIQFTYEEVEEE